MSKRLTPGTLGLYLGADSMYLDGLSFITPDFIAGCKIEEVTPILRLLSSMTEEEEIEWHTIRGKNILLPNKIATMQDVKSLDWLRSKGFDLGGWIEEEYADWGEDGPPGEYTAKKRTKWVPSLIDSGLAIEKGGESV